MKDIGFLADFDYLFIPLRGCVIAGTAEPPVLTAFALKFIEL